MPGLGRDCCRVLGGKVWPGGLWAAQGSPLGSLDMSNIRQGRDGDSARHPTPIPTRMLLAAGKRAALLPALHLASTTSDAGHQEPGGHLGPALSLLPPNSSRRATAGRGARGVGKAKPVLPQQLPEAEELTLQRQNESRGRQAVQAKCLYPSDPARRRYRACGRWRGCRIWAVMIPRAR